MQQAIRRLPHEKIVYFADTARLPYGGKSRETILRYSIENTIFLMEKDIKLLVVSCNTASACALDKLRQIFNIPIIGVIEPGAERAVQVTSSGHIAVLGTQATIKSGVYQKEIEKRLPSAKVCSIACPLFVPLVEERFLSHEVTRLVVKEYLKPLQGKNIDTLLLGCTHYPLLKNLIQEEVGKQVTIVDSATTCAEKIAETLNAHGMRSEAGPDYRFIVSDDPDKFRILGESILGSPIHNVSLKS